MVVTVLPSLQELNKHSLGRYVWRSEKQHSGMAPRSNPYVTVWRIESESGEPVTEWTEYPYHWFYIDAIKVLVAFARQENKETK